MLGLNEASKYELSKVDTYDFNIFNLRQLTDGRELEAVLQFIMVKRDCVTKTSLDINKMSNFISAIQNGYKNITYHNKTHGADLCQTFNLFLTQGKLGPLLKMDELDYLGTMTAACCHDFEHPGVNNVFLTKIQDPTAIRHNDVSVLENHHIAASFELMLGNPENNWAYKFTNEDFTRIR